MSWTAKAREASLAARRRKVVVHPPGLPRISGLSKAYHGGPIARGGTVTPGGPRWRRKNWPYDKVWGGMQMGIARIWSRMHGAKGRIAVISTIHLKRATPKGAIRGDRAGRYTGQVTLHEMNNARITPIYGKSRGGNKKYAVAVRGRPAKVLRYVPRLKDVAVRARSRA
jgi:hypothetical protein